MEHLMAILGPLAVAPNNSCVSLYLHEDLCVNMKPDAHKPVAGHTHRPLGT